MVEKVGMVQTVALVTVILRSSDHFRLPFFVPDLTALHFLYFGEPFLDTFNRISRLLCSKLRKNKQFTLNLTIVHCLCFSTTKPHRTVLL